MFFSLQDLFEYGQELSLRDLGILEKALDDGPWGCLGEVDAPLGETVEQKLLLQRLIRNQGLQASLT